jgi:hypothetical protein
VDRNVEKGGGTTLRWSIGSGCDGWHGCAAEAANPLDVWTAPVLTLPIENHARFGCRWVLLFMRSLALMCGLILALPPGWCCMLSPRASTTGARGEAKQVRSCCGHCKHSSKATHPSAPSRQPLPPGKCPCTDRDATSPDAFKILGSDLVLTSSTSVGDAVPCSVSFGHPIEVHDPPSDSSFLILHCVWRC